MVPDPIVHFVPNECEFLNTNRFRPESASLDREYISLLYASPFPISTSFLCLCTLPPSVGAF